MKLDNFVLYIYGSVMMPILIAMLIGMLIVVITSYLNFKKKTNDMT